MKGTWIEWLTLLFNGVIAIVALIGFAYTIYSNKDIASSLEVMKNTFEAYSDPIIKLKDFNWLTDSKEPLSCSHPPIGINFEYKNISNFPIKLKIEKLFLEFSANNLPSNFENFDTSKETTIIAPQSKTGFTSINKELFKSIFTNPNQPGIYTGKFIKIHIEGKISNLSETKTYKFNIIDSIVIDCTQFIKNIISQKYEYSLISHK